MGQLTGKHQDYDADYIFATVQTISKDDTLSLYEKDHFDAIIVDEAHHSAANSFLWNVVMISSTLGYYLRDLLRKEKNEKNYYRSI